MSRIIDNGVKFFCAGAVTVSGCRQGSPATLGFMALSRIAKRLERGSATSNNAALSVTAAELATTLTQNAETIRQSLNTIAESGFFTTFGPRPGEARALSVEIDRSDPHLEFAERLERGAEWWVYRGTIPPHKIDFNGL